jgi:hypothetical protein
MWVTVDRWNALVAELERLHFYEATLWECNAPTCKGLNHMSQEVHGVVRCWRCNRIRANWPRSFKFDAAGKS